MPMTLWNPVKKEFVTWWTVEEVCGLPNKPGFEDFGPTSFTGHKLDSGSVDGEIGRQERVEAADVWGR